MGFATIASCGIVEGEQLRIGFARVLEWNIGKAGDMLKSRDEFRQQVQLLVTQVQKWLDPGEWVTKVYEKKIRDIDHVVYTVPALFLQKGPVRILLDPVAYDAPGADAVIDLYLMPTYDDLASLFLHHGEWTIHYDPVGGANGMASIGEASARPFNREAINDVLNSMATNAVPSF